MNGRKIEKRKLKGYKVRDSAYEKAKKRAIKEGTHLATMIESAIESYARGSSFRYFYDNEQV